MWFLTLKSKYNQFFLNRILDKIFKKSNNAPDILSQPRKIKIKE